MIKLTGRGFGRLYELERGRVASQKDLDWRRLGGIRAACTQGAEELQKLFRGPHWESVHGMRNDVGVNVLGEMKAGRHPSRARIRIVVGNRWNARGIRKAHADRRGRSKGMRRARERFRGGRRCKHAGEQNSLRMSRPEAGLVHTEVVEGF